jgi:hypothetical protein
MPSAPQPNRALYASICAREAGLDCGHSRDPVAFSRAGGFSEHPKCSCIYLIPTSIGIRQRPESAVAPRS